MMGKSAFRPSILAAVLILVPLCFSQSRQIKRPTAPGRPVIQQQAVLFEETPRATKVVLKNGLTILAEEFKSKPVVSIQTHIQAGAADESPQVYGAARLIPLLVCRRPANKNTGTLEQDVYALGGILRTAVNYKSTKFEIAAPSAQWKKALNLLAEALMNPSFEQGDLMLESELLLSKAKGAADCQNEYLKEEILKLAFDPLPTGAYSEIAEGRLHGLKAGELSGFYRALYVPSRMIVVLSGDFSASEMLDETIRAFGKFPSVSGPAPSALKKTAKTGFRYRLLHGDTAVPQVVFGFRTIAENAADFRALEVLNSMLGLGEGSALKYRLRDQARLIWSAETGLWGDQNLACFLVGMEMDPKDIDRSQISALTEIELIKRKSPTEADVSRAVAQLEAEFWRRLENVTGRAEMLAGYNAIGDWKGRDRYVADLKKVKPADVRRVAAKYLRLENCALLEYLPGDVADRNPTEEGMRQTLEGLLQPSADEQEAKRDKETAPYLKIPRGASGYKFSEIQYPFQLASILRGPEIYIREDHTAPLLTMGMFFAGGKSDESKDSIGITKLMCDLIAGGTPEMQAGRFSQQLEIYGGRIRPVVRDDYFGFNFSIFSPYFEAGFNMLKQAVKAPVFEKESVDRQKKLQILDGMRRRYSAASAWDLVNRVLFQDYSYSKNSLGTAETISSITPAALVEWHSEHVKNRKPFVVIIGDTQGTSLASYFVKEFSGSRMRDARIPEAWVQPLAKGALIEQGWRKKHSLILIGFQAPPLDDEDGFAVTVLENLAGNMGRLSEELRYKMDAAHKVSVIYEPRLRGGSLIAYATTDPEHEEAVFKAMRQELLRIASGPNTYKDCAAAVNAAAGMNSIRSQDRFDQIDKVIRSMLAGKGLSDLQSLPAAFQDIDEEDLTEIAQRIFNMEKAAVIKMHGRSD